MTSTLPDGLPELTLGWQVLAWCTKYLRQPDGAHAGERWQFTPSQARFVLWLYAVDADGKWLYRRAALRWSKGRGKSPMLAALCLAQLCGPVVFSHFDQDGEPVGKEQPAAWIQIAATAEFQTVNTMAMVQAMCPKGSRLQTDYHLDVGKTIIYKPGGARLEIITASAKAAEGNRPTFVVMDEVQEWTASTGGHRLAETLRRNLGKMGGRVVEAGNAHIPGTDSVSEQTWEAFCAQRDGRAINVDILYDAVEAPADTDLTDPDSLRAGLGVCYADAPWQDLDRIMAEVWDVSTPEDQSKRYYLNQITAAEDAWCDPQEWAALSGRRELLPDEDIVMFFDGSKSRDATALIGCAMSDGYVFVLGIWEPDPKHTTESVVSAADVELTVSRAFEDFNVVAFFADVQEWQGQVLTDWPAKYEDRLIVWANKSGKQPMPIAWDMRTRVRDFTIAAETTETEIRERRFNHDGDSRLSRHVGNTRRRPNQWGYSVSKESPDSPRKIDACVCVIGARMVRFLVLSSDAWKRHLKLKNKKGRAIVLG